MGILLSGSKRVMIRADDPCYVVERGSVLVMLQPYEENRPIRRMYLGSAEQGNIIPSPVRPYIDDEVETSRTAVLVLEARTKEAQISYAEAGREIEAESFFSLSEELLLQEKPADRDEFWQIICRKYHEQEAEALDFIERHRSERKIFRSSATGSIGDTFKRTFSREILKPAGNDFGVYDAVSFLCARKRIKIAPYEDILKGLTEGEEKVTLQDIARRSGFAVRAAKLSPKWTRKTEEPFIGYLSDGDEKREVVVFPHRGVLKLFDPKTGEIRRVTKQDPLSVASNIFFVDRPFEKGGVTLKQVLAFAMKEISVSDILIYLIAMLLLSHVGVALSTLNQTIYDELIPRQQVDLVYGVCSIFIAALAANFLFTLAKNLTDYRIGIKAGNVIQLAIFHRVFHLPENFFRGRESAEQAYRITQLSSTYTSMLKSGWQISSEIIFSLIYFRRMYQCSPMLSAVGLSIAGILIVITFLFGALQRRTSRTRMQRTAGIRSYLYQAINGIGTIRMAGAEDAVLKGYMKKEGSIQENQGRIDFFQRTNALLIAVLNAAEMLLMYKIMGSGIEEEVTIGAFMGFLSANGMFSSMIIQASNSISMAVAMMPLLRDTGELLMTAPENGDEGIVLKNIDGDIVLSNVSYKYPNARQNVIEDMSLHIHPGEYVGIVGHSGCGKSTLMRLLLGFEKPTSGQIYYDGTPMDRLNLPELRRNLGAVLQDGSLMTGSILQNIRIAYPNATKDDIYRAIEMVGLKQEISELPMGLLTHVNDEALTLSGGQKQRILIARAIIGSPRVMLFDEATSSLDNISQEMISQALSSILATRIVVAHRLSTVRLCDRILVMDGGKIVESGNYDELMERRGRFYEMVQV